MQLLSPQTAAAQAKLTISRAPANITASGLGAGETVDVMIFDGVAYVPALDSSGAVITLTNARYMRELPGPGTYRLDKPVTLAAAGLSYNQNAS